MINLMLIIPRQHSMPRGDRCYNRAMIHGIEHTAIASPDPERLARWYVDHLGFVVNYHSPSSKTTFVKAANGSMIAMILANDSARGSNAMRDAGIRHLAIAVEDFETEYQRLKRAGVEFVSEPETSKGNRVVFFRDGDGNYLHLIERQVPLP